MRIHMTGRQIEVTQALKQAAEARLSRLEKYLDGGSEAHVILTVEKRRHRVEIVVHDRHATLSAVGETKDMYTSLSLVGDRLERQAKKHREKIKGERKRDGKRTSPRRLQTPAPESADGPQVIRVSVRPVKPMSIEEALLQVRGTEKEFLVFRNASSRQISVLYRRKDGNYGLIEPEA
ncbi:MAG TPA: ribosome-associated translation inhibitor RaiA [Candidatus Polarisedimenticolia bacterium]|jgi:putative sigma-54 modulation protein|nr:ribosome-associated translation inhibitor RaiA [Candidatus Polarisedimenticolia bacterium]